MKVVPYSRSFGERNKKNVIKWHEISLLKILKASYIDVRWSTTSLVTNSQLIQQPKVSRCIQTLRALEMWPHVHVKPVERLF